MADSQTHNRTLPVVNLVVSAILLVALGFGWWTLGSQLAMAQAADSLMDVFTAAVLTFTMSISALPEDENHPFGHTRAQPIGALVVAVLAGVLAFEVFRSSVEALVAGDRPQLELWLLGVFAGKGFFKLGLYFLARSKGKRSPALKALAVDARNDVLITLVAVAGFFGALAGMPTLDAWLALPIALWIAWAGIELARDNIRLLMGEAPSSERQTELLAIARAAPDVREAHDLRAHYLGTMLHVHVHVEVDPDLTVREAHDIGEKVRIAIEEEQDVTHCSVHIDYEPPDKQEEAS
jgi:ferrous-iron efflux pump FieF